MDEKLQEQFSYDLTMEYIRQNNMLKTEATDCGREPKLESVVRKCCLLYIETIKNVKENIKKYSNENQIIDED